MESNTENELVEQQEQSAARVIDIGQLLEYLRRVKDGRKRRGIRYRLEVILALFILAKLCGENKVYGIADWVQLRSAYLIEALDLKLKRQRLPHNSTYRGIRPMKLVRMNWKSFSASIWHNFRGGVRIWSL